MRGKKNEAAKRIVESLKSILSVESSSTAKKGASTLWRATGRALVKNRRDSYCRGQRGRGIGLDRYDHEANGTACPKILTSLDRRFDWLGQSRPRCRKKRRLPAEGARGRQEYSVRRRRCEWPRRGRRTRPPRRMSTRQGCG